VKNRKIYAGIFLEGLSIKEILDVPVWNLDAFNIKKGLHSTTIELLKESYTVKKVSDFPVPSRDDTNFFTV
jgi:hypothetical protein